MDMDRAAFIPHLSLPGSAASSKRLGLSEPQAPHLSGGGNDHDLI